jgi:hydrogenase maturation protein HypF
MIAGRRIAVSGTVQGVGFRPYVYRLARAHGVGGRVRNDDAGVVIEAFAAERALDDFVAELTAGAPGRMRTLVSTPIAAEEARGFAIEASRRGVAPALSIPPDLATCPECLAETRDPRARRHGYAFTNCTRCGPRFTIALDLPYDRPRTTMAGFPMCPACRREYEDPADRRFHAQPIACPACGPRLDEPVEAAARRIVDGQIVAVKGLGGFHLACDATSEAAVARLRARKRRDQKPFAVLVADVDAARALAELSDADAALLGSDERPITLVRGRPGALAAGVAPDTPLVGLLLPYTPLHHALAAAVGRPIVLTSGNLADEPIACDDAEARVRLARIADAFLGHDRPIASRCDDSVARVIAGAPVVLRRARGHVPAPVALGTRVAVPVLACGAQLKNSFCLARDDSAWLGPHVGDLDNEAAYAFFCEAVERMERLVRVRPERVAHDLHPDYLSTRYAMARPERAIAVQHHHAHVASAMAEHGLDGEVLGLAWDGAGLGPDGASWGGELLLASYRGFRRLGTFRPVALAGGDRAIRQPWRVAVALLDDAFDGDPPPAALARIAAAPADVRVVRQMIARGLQVQRAHGVGRLFDGCGALVLGRAVAAYEGQVAAAWNHAVDPAERGRYPFTIDDGVVDTRPMVRALACDLDRPGVAAARFHNTLIAAGAELVRAAQRAHGALPIVATGGCFANPILAEGLVAELGDVRLQRAVPPGDGGLALGQALVAAAIGGP